MPPVLAQKTLERLEWPRIVARWRDHCRTHDARRALAPEPPAPGSDGAQEGPEEPAPLPGALFAETPADARQRLVECDEARVLLAGDEAPPLPQVGDLAPALGRAARGGGLAGVQLVEVGQLLASLRALRRFFLARRDEAPHLCDVAECLVELEPLRQAIDRALEPSGEVRDDATPALRSARGEAQRLAGEIRHRLDRMLQNADVQAALSDRYVTVRNERYVLPVRADMRGRVRGIVHDASSSGTTLFVEPEAAVDANNRLRQAELSAQREVERILHELSAGVAEERGTLASNAALLAHLDLALARGRLSLEMEGTSPELGEEGVIDLPRLRHPLLSPEEAVPNDLGLGRDETHVMVISGPNGGGKTVTMKAVALAVLMARAGLHVAAGRGARVDWMDGVLADIGDEQDIRESLSTFSAHMANVASIVRDAGPRSLVVLDEIGVGTDPSEGAALAQAVLESLADAGARVIATTHYNLLKEMAGVDPRFCNASMEFDARTLAPTFRLHPGVPGASSASALARRMGMPEDVLGRAERLLEREDRQLDRLLGELASTRSALEREKEEAARLRREGESTRDAYREKLERLQARRDQLYQEMKRDLDHAFRDAHEKVADVIRDLQRGGRAQDAARARERLQDVAEQAERRIAETGARAPAPAAVEDTGRPLDWEHAAPGDPVRVAGGQRGVLEGLPDRKGRVQVRVGAARLVVPRQQVRTGGPEPGSRGGARVSVERAGQVHAAVEEGLRAGGLLACDLRGQRVAPALEELSKRLDQAARDGHDGLRVVHGLGTGALRDAVREQLRASPYVRRVRPGEDGEGGDGVTVAELARG